MFRGRTIVAAAWRLVALSSRRVGDTQAPVQAPVYVASGPLVVPADHEYGNLFGSGEADQDPPLPGAWEVDTADPLDLIAGQSVVGRTATTARQVGLDPFHATPNVRPETTHRSEERR